MSCGLFVSVEHPMIAASPDGVIDNNTLCEFKCPFSAYQKTISPKSVPYLIEENGTLTLKKTHDYYYQVQGQLHCAERQVCKFIVYTGCDILIIDIVRDDLFIAAMTDKLCKFYDEYFCSAIIDRHFYRQTHMFHFKSHLHI
jgi:hypothetical protein